MYCGYKFLVKPQVGKQAAKVLPLNRVLESRMALKLDDLIGKKKEVAQVLDLSKATANNAEEFKKLMEKVPEFKIKPEKLKPEDVKIHDFTRKWRRKKKTKAPTAYQFADPLPEEMRSIRLEDLCPVNIQWNMLTTLRPKTKADTEYFSRRPRGSDELKSQKLEPLQPSASPKVPSPPACSIPRTRPIQKPQTTENPFQKCTARSSNPSRNQSTLLSPGQNRVHRLVELGKLEIATLEKEKKNPDSSFMRKMKNRAGITESREPLVETIGKKEPEQKRGRSTAKSRKKAKTRSKSTRKSSDRGKKPRARSSSKTKKEESSPKPKSKSRSRSKSKSKSKAPVTVKSSEEEKVQKKVKVTVLAKKKSKVGAKQ